MALIFEHHTARAGKARAALALHRWLLLIKIACMLIILGGVGLLAFHSAAGWFVLTLSSIPGMVLCWYYGALDTLVYEKNNDTVDGRLEVEVLGLLKPDPSPIEIADAAMRSRSGQFLAARYGVTTQMIQNIVPHVSSNTQAIWDKTDAIRRTVKSEYISGAMIIVALISQYEHHEQLLANNHTTFEDLIKGVRWRLRIDEILNRFKQPHRTGGIARDWSFGYTPLLDRHAQNISLAMAYSHDLSVPTEPHVEIINRLVETMSVNGRQNAVLVGAAGSGKTSIINAFAARLIDARSDTPDNLRFRQVYMLDSASLVASAPGRGELEQLVIRILNEAYYAKNIILCFDNAQLFFEEGVGAVDLTNVLQPILDAGRLRVILSMDEQRYLQIGQRNPSLVNSVTRIAVNPSSYEDTMEILQEQAILIESRRGVLYSHQSLKEAYRLSERYMHDLVMPGRAINLMEAAASFAEEKYVTINSVQAAIEKTINVKVSVASESAEREKLLNLETEIHARMVGQERAVQVVSDALRRARAGVRNENRPIGTFLFLGPTGVGKTELSKALAEVYFGGEGQMIRLDLNEFVQASDVVRLIADGADDPTSLTSQVMKKPFSVILLDEIEKAAPEVLATLLQVLDEGILRDIKNREVSFRDAIIIATSNAGAERIREYVEKGYEIAQFEPQFIDELITSNLFRPEFLNRFDEIVVFSPLDKTHLLQIIDLMLAGVNKTLHAQRIKVEVNNAAKLLLVDKGYDPRLGARPMRRMIQKAVENTVAKKILSGQAQTGSTVLITEADINDA